MLKLEFSTRQFVCFSALYPTKNASCIYSCIPWKMSVYVASKCATISISLEDDDILGGRSLDIKPREKKLSLLFIPPEAQTRDVITEN